MPWVIVALATLAAVEVAFRSPLERILQKMHSISARIRRVLTSPRISDHWKQRVLPHYAGQIFLNSLQLFSCLLLIALPVIALDLLARPFHLDLVGTLVSPTGLGLSIVVAALYGFARHKLRYSSHYTPLQKLLHFLVLPSSSVGEALYSFETRTLTIDRRVAEEQHVFVSGFARAGTTILMRALYNSGQFASLTYADMPFVLAPNFWSKLNRESRNLIASKERAHGDGVFIGVDSPEALDEVFWRVFAHRDYVDGDCLRGHRASTELINKFRQYIGAILVRYGKQRYLSKNNNNLLRLESIQGAFQNALIIIPFRDPLQHSTSLLRQHLHFSREQTRDPFIRAYMGWLGHHEFGLTHKRFCPTGSAMVHTEPDTVEYWLEQWNIMYRWVLEKPISSSSNILFLSYEGLCADTETVWGYICERLGLFGPPVPELELRNRAVKKSTDSRLFESAMQTYHSLDARFRQAIASRN